MPLSTSTLLLLGLAQGAGSPAIAPDSSSTACAEVMLQRDFTQLRAKVIKNLTICESGKPTDKVLSEMFFASLLWYGAEKKKLSPSSQSSLLGRIDNVAAGTFSNPGVRLLQGWWLSSVASDAVFRRDKPSSSVRKKVKFPNGTETWVTEIRYDSVDPRLVRGQKLCEEALLSAGNTPLGMYFRMRTMKNFPVSGVTGLRSAYIKTEAPFQWTFMHELIFRDAAATDAGQLKATWKRLSSMEERPIIVRYLAGEKLKEAPVNK
jgi:hypothetical protein